MTATRSIFRNLLLSALLATFAALVATAAAQEGDGQSASPSETSGEDPVVLQAGDYQETLSDLEARFEIAIRGIAASEGVELNESIRSQLEAFKTNFLEQRATEVALRQEAERRGIEVSDEEVDELVSQITGSLPEGQTFESLLEQAGFQNEEQLRAMVRETEYIQRAIDAIEADITLTEEQVQQFYDENAAAFQTTEQVCARHILVETEEEAQQVLTDLEAGGDFAEIADERSVDTASEGGDLGCFGRGRMVAPFEEAAFDAQVGEPVGPIESQFGHHVILVYDTVEPSQVPLEEVRAPIEQQLREQQLVEEVEAVVEAAGVETFPERLGTAAPATEGDEPAGNEDPAAADGPATEEEGVEGEDASE